MDKQIDGRTNNMTDNGQTDGHTENRQADNRTDKRLDVPKERNVQIDALLWTK